MIKNLNNIKNTLKVAILLIITTKCITAQNLNTQMESASSYIAKNKTTKALSILDNIEEQCISSDDVIKQKFYYCKGVALFQAKEFIKAIPYLNNSLQFIETKQKEDDCQYLKTLYSVANCYKNIGEYEKAESCYRKAIIANDILPNNCDVISQVYLEIIELYKLMNNPTLADYCVKQFEKYKLNNRLQGKDSNWSEIVDNLYLELPDIKQLREHDKSRIIRVFTSILETINSNIGRYNDDYIQSCRLFAVYMLICKDTNYALELNKELISIGKKLSTHKPEIAEAYYDYLDLMSRLNEVKIVKNIIPEAIDYNNATLKSQEHSLLEMSIYEIVGVGFYEDGNLDVGVEYLEYEWDRSHHLSIKSLSALAEYYYEINPQKSLEFFRKAEDLLSSPKINDETKFYIYSSIMKLYSHFGNYSEAIVYGKKAGQYAQDIDILTVHLSQCAHIYGRLNDVDNMERLFSFIDSVYYNKLSTERKFQYLSAKGYTYTSCKKYDLAIKALTQSIEIAPTEKKETILYLETVFHNLGRAYMLQSNYEKALYWLYKSRDLQKSNHGTVLEKTKNYIKECETRL